MRQSPQGCVQEAVPERPSRPTVGVSGGLLSPIRPSVVASFSPVTFFVLSPQTPFAPCFYASANLACLSIHSYIIYYTLNVQLPAFLKL